MANTTLSFRFASNHTTLTCKLYDLSTGAVHAAAAATYTANEGTPSGDGDSPYTLTVPEAVTVAQAELVILSTSPAAYLGSKSYSNIEDIVHTYHAGQGGAGSGFTAYTLTVQDSVSSAVIPNAAVWVTSDIGGSTLVSGTLRTDSLGQVTVMLTTGTTYYLWLVAAGYTSVTAFTFIAGTTSTTITMDATAAVTLRYITRDDLETRMSVLGAAWVADQDWSGVASEAEKIKYLDSAGIWAEDLFDHRMLDLYTTAEILADRYMLSVITDLAVCRAASVGGIRIPRSLKNYCEKAEKALDMLAEGTSGQPFAPLALDTCD